MSVSPVSFQAVNYQPNVRKNNNVTFHAAPAASDKLVRLGKCGAWLEGAILWLVGAKAVKEATEENAEPSTPASAEAPDSSASAISSFTKPKPVDQ